MFIEVIATVLLVTGVRSQGAVSYSVNHDGSSSFGGKMPIAHSDSNVLSLVASKTSTGAVGRGIAFDNAAGHGLSLTQTNIPNFGSQLTGAGNVNLLHTSNHRLDANGFVTRNMPNIPNVPVPNFNTVGGGVDYMYKNTVGASVGAARTPFLQRTDYSAMGKLNLYQSPKSSVDLSAGFGKSVSPQLNTGWKPAAGLTFTRYFNFGR